MKNVCYLCNKDLETTFLDKIVGTMIKSKSGKKVLVCSLCQKEHKDKLFDKVE